MGEKYMGAKSVGEKYMGEKSVGEKYMGGKFESTRRRMARERRGAESSSAVSMATLYYKTIY